MNLKDKAQQSYQSEHMNKLSRHEREFYYLEEITKFMLKLYLGIEDGITLERKSYYNGSEKEVIAYVADLEGIFFKLDKGDLWVHSNYYSSSVKYDPWLAVGTTLAESNKKE